ncbi:hypothetical protein ACIBPB_22660 [Micromonospora sp. NPDC049836]|uniref:hypothetical protein n=1 Tax=Micromonospora sp. NPDC049836 TaxID=3364274 RepID=UPI0037AAD07B
MTTAGGTYPEPVAQAFAELKQVRATGGQIPRPTVVDLARAVLDAIRAGRDPLDDEQVRRTVTARGLDVGMQSGIANALADACELHIFDLLRDHFDDIIDTLKTACDRLGQILTDAHGILGDADLADANAVLQLGPDAARAWADVKAAAQKIDVISMGWQTLAELTQRASAQPTVRLANVDLDTFERLGHKADAWTLVRNGQTIDLATRQTARERADQLAEAREQRARDHANEFTNAYRRSQGVAA